MKKSEVSKARNIECPHCHSLEWRYVDIAGKKLIVSPCGWELVELQGPSDDLDWDGVDDYE